MSIRVFAVEANKRRRQFRLGDAGTDPLLLFEQKADERVAQETGRAGDDPTVGCRGIAHG